MLRVASYQPSFVEANMGDFFSDATSFVGDIFSGDIGDAASNLASSAFTATTGIPSPDFSTGDLGSLLGNFNFNGGGTSVSPPAATFPVAAAAPILPGAVTGVISAGAQFVRTFLAVVSAKLGQKVSVARILELVRRVGPVAAAAGLGVGLESLLKFVTLTTKKHRRAKGISARDMKITRRTTRKLIRFSHDMRELCSKTPVRTRSVRACK